MASESVAVGEWEQENGVKIRMIVARWWERSWKRTEGFDDEEDSGWGCDRAPSGYKRGIDRRGTDFGNGLGGGRSDMLGGNVDGWMGGEPENFLQSTRTLLVEECVLRQTLGGRKKRRCWRTRWHGWTGQ